MDTAAWSHPGLLCKEAVGRSLFGASPANPPVSLTLSQVSTSRACRRLRHHVPNDGQRTRTGQTAGENFPKVWRVTNTGGAQRYRRFTPRFEGTRRAGFRGTRQVRSHSVRCVGGCIGTGRWLSRKVSIGTLPEPRCWAPSPREANVDFPFDVRPFFSLPQAPDEVIESRRVSRAVLEPGEEIELLTDIASVMKASRNGG